MESIYDVFKNYLNATKNGVNLEEWDRKLSQFKEYPDAWRECIRVASSVKDTDFLFYVGNVLEEAIGKRWKSLSLEDQNAIRTFVLVSLKESHHHLKPWVLKKMIRVVVLLGKRMWPHTWADFFALIYSWQDSPDTVHLGLLAAHIAAQEFPTSSPSFFALQDDQTKAAESFRRELPKLCSVLEQTLNRVARGGMERHLVAALHTLSSIISDNPLGQHITPSLLEQLKSVVTAEITSAAASPKESFTVIELSLQCVAEFCRKDKVPPSLGPALLEIAKLVFESIQLVIESKRLMRLPPLVLGLAEAGETLVSHHWLRLEKSDSFPLPLFLKAWYEFTVNQDDPDGFLRCLGAWSHVLDLVVSGHCGQHKVYETAVTTLSRNLVFNLRRSGGGSLSLSCGTDVEEVQSPDAAESHRKGSEADLRLRAAAEESRELDETDLWSGVKAVLGGQTGSWLPQGLAGLDLMLGSAPLAGETKQEMFDRQCLTVLSQMVALPGIAGPLLEETWKLLSESSREVVLAVSAQAKGAGPSPIDAAKVHDAALLFRLLAIIVPAIGNAEQQPPPDLIEFLNHTVLSFCTRAGMELASARIFVLGHAYLQFHTYTLHCLQLMCTWMGIVLAKDASQTVIDHLGSIVDDYLRICAVAVDIATSPPPESVIESSAAIVAALSKLSPFLRSLTLSRGPFLKFVTTYLAAADSLAADMRILLVSSLANFALLPAPPPGASLANATKAGEGPLGAQQQELLRRIIGRSLDTLTSFVDRDGFVAAGLHGEKHVVHKIEKSADTLIATAVVALQAAVSGKALMHDALKSAFPAVMTLIERFFAPVPTPAARPRRFPSRLPPVDHSAALARRHRSKLMTAIAGGASLLRLLYLLLDAVEMEIPPAILPRVVDATANAVLNCEPLRASLAQQGSSGQPVIPVTSAQRVIRMLLRVLRVCCQITGRATDKSKHKDYSTEVVQPVGKLISSVLATVVIPKQGPEEYLFPAYMTLLSTLLLHHWSSFVAAKGASGHFFISELAESQFASLLHKYLMALRYSETLSPSSVRMTINQLLELNEKKRLFQFPPFREKLLEPLGITVLKTVFEGSLTLLEKHYMQLLEALCNADWKFFKHGVLTSFLQSLPRMGPDTGQALLSTWPESAGGIVFSLSLRTLLQDARVHVLNA